jgi:hypothetical protein
MYSKEGKCNFNLKSWKKRKLFCKYAKEDDALIAIIILSTYFFSFSVFHYEIKLYGNNKFPLEMYVSKSFQTD